MVWFFYYLLMYLFVAGMKAMALLDKKTKAWVSGRKGWKKQLEILPAKAYARIWFHVSSLGEFEQARPVIEKLKARDPALDIILTFFSPSGYAVRSSYPLASVFYLPADLPGNADKWLDMVKPDLAVFIKYDLWPGFLRGLKNRHIPAILFSAHWTKSQTFASFSIPPTRTLLFGFKQIFLQQGDDQAYFRQKGFHNLNVAGDTRIDRALQLPGEANSKIPDILRSLQPFDLVAGSTWPRDEKLIIEAVQKLNLSIILAPHDVSKENIDRLVNAFPLPVTRLSSLIESAPHPGVIVIDNIGLLAFLYALGKIAYVGGGFGSGIHNTLEPMAHRKPLIFGPAYKKFPEAVAMVADEAAIAVRDTEGLIEAIRHFQQPENTASAGTKSYHYLQKQKGASDQVANYILDSIPFGLKV
jgi:3-deoxy-D-manno-octulosonic-acid transferase